MSKNEEKGGLSLTDIVKKVALASLGSASFAKDVITDRNKPKEMIFQILNRAEKTKDDIMEILAKEISKFLGKINVSEELAKALKDLVINVSASVDFGDKKGVTKSNVKIKKADVLHKTKHSTRKSK